MRVVIRPTGRLLVVLLVGLLLIGALATPPGAQAAGDEVEREMWTTVSDGVDLRATLTGAGPLRPRPTVVEFTPYGDDAGTLEVGPHYNSLLVQLRGTGDSHGRFDALGPRSQRDVVEVLRWACRQPWSDGNLALNGYSASAIVLYNSWHRRLPCVRAAIMRSGTHELYRDLLVPGGISNLLPGIGVLGLIGAPALAQGAERDPATVPDALAGLVASGVNAGLARPILDRWWRQRGWRGDANDIPVLVVNGFFDVESRGAFEAYRALREDGAHLLMAGGHDGAPAGTDNGVGEARAWLDHHVRGLDNGVERHPRVQLMMSDGSRLGYLAGDVVRHRARDWPVPGTRWASLRLDAARSGSATSLNDGTLRLGRPRQAATQSWPNAPSLPTSTDVPNAAIVGASGLNQVSSALPVLADMKLAEPLGLSYTTPPLDAPVRAAGPASLEIDVSTTSPQGHLWAVVSDVAPDGTANPLTVGRLSTEFPEINRRRSLVRDGDVVQPYGRYNRADPPTPGEVRRYHVELWPIGNRFRAGHRIRLHLVGASAASRPGVPGLNSVEVGPGSGARLLLPVLPGSNLRKALTR